MEDPHLVEQHDRYAAARSLADFRAETDKQRFDVLPGNVRAGGVGEDCIKRLQMSALHNAIVPSRGTKRNQRRGPGPQALATA